MRVRAPTGRLVGVDGREWESTRFGVGISQTVETIYAGTVLTPRRKKEEKKIIYSTCGPANVWLVYRQRDC